MTIQRGLDPSSFGRERSKPFEHGIRSFGGPVHEGMLSSLHYQCLGFRAIDRCGRQALGHVPQPAMGLQRPVQGQHRHPNSVGVVNQVVFFFWPMFIQK